MKQREVVDTLHSLHFVGKWSQSKLASLSGLSRPVIRRAFDGDMSAVTHTRLEMLFKDIEPSCPTFKRKPGKSKRFLIRYSNLKRWIDALETEFRIKKFKTKNYRLTKQNDGYVCTKFDYILKWYLLEFFGEELKKKKVFLGDCFPVEKWIERISALFPERRDLWKALKQRPMK